MGWQILPGFNSWHNMMQRCCNTEHRGYKDYGGRGITVCERWKTPFEGYFNFIADLGPPPPGHSIGRIDNEGNYEPGNCRWETNHQQARNRRNNVVITAFGETGVITDLCKKYGAKVNTVSYRLKKGMTPEQALTASSSKGLTRLRKIKAFGKTKHLEQWAREVGLSSATISDRLAYGWTAEEALSTPAAANGKIHAVEAFGKTWPLAQLCKEYNVTRSAVAYRINQGMSAEEAVNTVRANKRQPRGLITAFGETKTLVQWCKGRGLRVSTVANRLAAGKTPEEALTAPVRPYKKRG